MRYFWFKVRIAFSVKLHVFIIKVYYATKTYAKVIEEFKNDYPESGNIPNTAIKRLIDKFEKTSSEQEAPELRKEVVTSEQWCKIIQLIEATPTISSHCLASQVQVLCTWTYGAIWETKFSYHIRIFQELKLPDAGKRLHFYHWLRNFIHNHYSILNYISFCDEAWFHLNGYINAQNYRVWSSTNSHMYQEVSLHALKLGVWCVMSHCWIISQSSLTQIFTNFIAFLKHSEINSWFQ